MNRFFYKFMPINDFTLENLSKNQIWFSSPLKFNDPFDYFVPTNLNYEDNEFINLLRKSQNIPTQKCEQVLEYYNNNPKALEHWYEIGHTRFAKNSRVACFCEMKTEILMWSHYADFHKGICLKFDSFLDKPFFHEENWSYKKLPISEVRYPIDFISPKYFKKNIDFFQNTVYTKYHKWEYEKEHRIISAVDAIKINKESLTEINFGCRCKKEKQEKIREVIKVNDYPNVKFIEAKKSKTDFALEFNEISEGA